MEVLLVCLGVIAFQLFLRWKAPVMLPPNDLDEVEIPSWCRPAIYIVILVTAVVLTVAGGLLLVGLNYLIAVARDPSALILTPTWATWFLYTGFASLLLGWPLMRFAIKRIMGETLLAAYEQRDMRQAGFDPAKALKWMAWILMVPLTFLLLLSLGCHSRFSANEFAFQDFGDWSEHRYSYTDIERLGVIAASLDKDGSLIERQIAVRLKNGHLWDSLSMRNPSPFRPDLLELLERKTGLQAIEIEHGEKL